MLLITRIITNLLYFPCTLSDYLSYNIIPAQRHNSHLGVVRRYWWSVRISVECCCELVANLKLLIR